MNEYVGYVVRFENVSGEKAAQVIQVIRPYLAVLDNFDGSKPADTVIGELMPFMGSEGKKHHYIPIVFTETLADEIVRKINGINVYAEYVEHELGNEVYIEDIDALLPILYSHIKFEQKEDNENSSEPELITYMRDLLYIETLYLTITRCKSVLNGITSKNEEEVYKKHRSKLEPWSVGLNIFYAIALAIVGPIVWAILTGGILLSVGMLSEDASFCAFIVGSIIIWVACGLSIIVVPIRNKIMDPYSLRNLEKINEKTDKELVINDKYNEMLARLEAFENKVKNTGEILYSTELIGAKYRSFIPIARLYDYVSHYIGDSPCLKMSGLVERYEDDLYGTVFTEDISYLYEYPHNWTNQSLELRLISETRTIVNNILEDGKLDELIRKSERKCRRIQEKFKRYERFLEAHR